MSLFRVSREMDVVVGHQQVIVQPRQVDVPALDGIPIRRFDRR